MKRKEINLENVKKAFEDAGLGTELVDLVVKERELEMELQKVRKQIRDINKVS